MTASMKARFVQERAGLYQVYTPGDHPDWIGTVEKIDARDEDALLAAGVRGVMWKAESVYGGDETFYAATREKAAELIFGGDPEAASAEAARTSIFAQLRTEAGE